MFVSEVGFISEKSNEATLKSIIENKLDQLSNINGLLSKDYQVNDLGDEIEYRLITKWEEKVQFQKWMKASHSGGNHGKKPIDNRPKIRKDGKQYEINE